MALIVCPHCGKNVSDTAEKCIHCGFDFHAQEIKADEQTKKKEFTNLTEYEQIRLKQEFDITFGQFAKINKNFGKIEKINKFLDVIATICGISVILSLIIFRIVKLDFDSHLALAAVVIIYNVLSVLFCILKFLVWNLAVYRKRERDHYAYLKKFKIWLNDEKNINYDLALTKRERKIMNGIFLENYFN